MLFKLFHLLGLFAYLNTIVYEAGFSSVSKDTSLDGHSLVEYVFDDLLNLPGNTTHNIKVPNEEYSMVKVVTPAFIAVACFLFYFLYRQLNVGTASTHPFYKARSFCLPGYYSFLFRLKPF